MIKYRPHRELLAESMAGMVVLEATYEAVLAYVSSRWDFSPAPVSIYAEKYGTYDNRIGWDTYIVLARLEDDTVYPIGYTNGPISGRLLFKHTDASSELAPEEIAIDATLDSVLDQLARARGRTTAEEVVISRTHPQSHRANVFVKTETGLRKYGEIDWPLVIQDTIGTVTYRHFRTIAQHHSPSPIKVRATYADLLETVRANHNVPETTTSITVVEQPESNLWLVYAIGEHGYLPIGLIDGPIYAVPKYVKSIYAISHLEIRDSKEKVLVPIQFLFQIDCDGNGFTSGPVVSRPFQFKETTLELDCVINAASTEHELAIDVDKLQYFEIVGGSKVRHYPSDPLYCTGYQLTLDLSARGQGGSLK